MFQLLQFLATAGISVGIASAQYALSLTDTVMVPDGSIHYTK